MRQKMVGPISSQREVIIFIGPFHKYAHGQMISGHASIGAVAWVYGIVAEAGSDSNP